MRSRVLAAATLAALVARSVGAFYATSTPAAAVPESDRVSSDQQFAKTWEIRSRSPYPLTMFRVDVPGRVFFSHVDNTSSDASVEAGDVFGRIKVSGSSAQTLELFDASSQIGGSISSDESLHLKLKEEAPVTDALLVEVQLLRRNALKSVALSGDHDCDVVLLENVLYSSDRDPFLAAKNYISTKRITLTISGGNGSIFVSDKSGVVTMNTLDVTLFGKGSVQVELAALTTNNSASLSAGGVGDVLMFVDDLRADVDITVGYKNAKGNVCISPAAANNANVTVLSGPEAQASYPGKKSDSVPCVKLALPKRVPVSKHSSVVSSTPVPSATTSAASLNGATLLSLTGVILSVMLAIS